MAEIAPSSTQGSTRDAIRWSLLLSAVAVTGFRLPRTYSAFRDWREVRFSDPPQAELYRLNFAVNAVGILIILVLACAVFYFLRPRTQKQP
ncbi:MAG TPA: hypothetical protein VNB49_11540 [Candidatus Dormibacteraeota bacterium]|nr:hypothetical protein [Candidatus Dormibacteraeota bacterium]